MPIPGGEITSSDIWVAPAEPAVEEVVEDSTKEETE